jgi:DNA-binding YbaB/EbfC family protein
MRNLGDIQKLAQKMQADMAQAQEDLAGMTVEGSAGGGAVVVVMTGTQECRAVRIQKDAVDPDDVETLEDLVRAATTDALAKAKQLAADKLGGLTGGLKLPGL